MGRTSLQDLPYLLMCLPHRGYGDGEPVCELLTRGQAYWKELVSWIDDGPGDIRIIGVVKALSYCTIKMILNRGIFSMLLAR